MAIVDMVMAYGDGYGGIAMDTGNGYGGDSYGLVEMDMVIWWR